MERQPITGLDPERFREERHDVDLGQEEPAFGSAASDCADGERRDSTLGQPTAGSTPPAR